MSLLVAVGASQWATASPERRPPPEIGAATAPGADASVDSTDDVVGLPTPAEATPLTESFHMCPSDHDSSEHEPKIEPEIRAPRLNGPIRIDGRVEETAWDAAVRVTGFTEIQPGDQVAPPVCTGVLLGYDDDHLYVAFLAHDDRPESIRTSLRNRDDILRDDWVGVIIDPYGDATQAYEIFANAIGVQGDLLLTTDEEDAGFDLVYRSDGRITDQGYVVEMAIPFSSLRFPAAPVQRWGFTLMRSRPRESRQKFSWATVDRDEPCFMCQFGTLTGLEDIAPGTNLGVIPAVVGAQSQELDADASDTRLGSPSRQLEPSVNLRYAITPGVFAEATVNPDFSQVESDADQIDVNSTFALSFPERRPFFQEGIDLFETAASIVYTRSINAPLAAGKMTGRFGRTSVAYLTALDEQTPLLLPFEERSDLIEVGQSVSNILRTRRTFGQNSFVGVTVTDRRLLDYRGGGSVLSADGAVDLGTNYRFTGQVSISDNREPASASLSDAVTTDEAFGDERTPALDGERYQGYGVRGSFRRDARHWDFRLSAFHYSPTFRAPNGFIRRNDYHQMRIWQGYMFYLQNRFIERFQARTFGAAEHNLDGVLKEAYGRVGFWSQLIGQTYVASGVELRRERYAGQMFERMLSWDVDASTNFTEVLRLGAYVEGGDAINRGTIERGTELYVNAWASVDPWQHLTLTPEVAYATLRDPSTGDPFYEGYIVRARSSIQFTREWSLRLVTQYNHFDSSVSVEPLLRYQLNPFSILYVGSTHGYDVAEGGAQTFATDRQFFFKLQYLFRL